LSHQAKRAQLIVQSQSSRGKKLRSLAQEQKIFSERLDAHQRRLTDYSYLTNPTEKDNYHGARVKSDIELLKYGLELVEMMREFVLKEIEEDWVEDVGIATQENLVRRLRNIWEGLSEKNHVLYYSNFFTPRRGV
jgi:hypothetical protein